MSSSRLMWPSVLEYFYSAPLKHQSATQRERSSRRLQGVQVNREFIWWEKATGILPFHSSVWRKDNRDRGSARWRRWNRNRAASFLFQLKSEETNYITELIMSGFNNPLKYTSTALKEKTLHPPTTYTKHLLLLLFFFIMHISTHPSSLSSPIHPPFCN